MTVYDCLWLSTQNVKGLNLLSLMSFSPRPKLSAAQDWSTATTENTVTTLCWCNLETLSWSSHYIKSLHLAQSVLPRRGARHIMITRRFWLRLTRPSAPPGPLSCTTRTLRSSRPAHWAGSTLGCYQHHHQHHQPETKQMVLLPQLPLTE